MDSVLYENTRPFTFDGTECTAKVVKVVDGDTYWLAMELCDHKVGLPSIQRLKVRLAGCNAPELGTEEGEEIKKEMVERLENELVHVSLGKFDKYGRPLATIIHKDRHINKYLIDKFGKYM